MDPRHIPGPRIVTHSLTPDGYLQNTCAVQKELQCATKELHHQAQRVDFLFPPVLFASIDIDGDVLLHIVVIIDNVDGIEDALVHLGVEPIILANLTHLDDLSLLTPLEGAASRKSAIQCSLALMCILSRSQGRERFHVQASWSLDASEDSVTNGKGHDPLVGSHCALSLESRDALEGSTSQWLDHPIWSEVAFIHRVAVSQAKREVVIVCEPDSKRLDPPRLHPRP
mmetsp:Transcript_157/g.321  ORF Transcript_157/g.321 Transcript_157/m.321 type:complete len:227 (-) Transcript_157:152-832(-)